MFHLDIAQGSVRATPDDEIYIYIYVKLPGGRGGISEMVVRLNRSLHGQNQSDRQWAGLFVETEVDYGMEQCRSDSCVSHSCGRQGSTDHGRICRRHNDRMSGRGMQRFPCRAGYDCFPRISPSN